MPANREARPHRRDLIRTVHIINDLSIGGAEMMLCKLLSEIDRSRFESVVVSLRNHGPLRRQLESLGIPVYSVAMRLAIPTPTSCLRLIRLVRRLNPDLIQGWLPHSNLAAQVSAAFARRPVFVVWNIRQSLYSFDYEKRTTAAVIRLCARLSNLPSRIVYNSRTGAAQHGTIGYPTAKSLVIPNGFSTELFAPSQEARRAVREELGVSDNTILVGLVGRFHPQKDHRNFLQALTLLHQTHPDVCFVLCGHGMNKSNPALRNLTNELKNDERLFLLDERRDIPRLMPALDIATCSSYAESFPNVVGEAMSSGVPCVVTDVSDLMWIIGETGLVVPPRNPEALADALRKLVDLGPEGRQALGKAARERVMKYFDLESIVSNYEDLYESVITQQPSTLHHVAQQTNNLFAQTTPIADGLLTSYNADEAIAMTDRSSIPDY